MTEQEKQNRNELIRLIQENPELPVAPMVNGELVGDDCGYWLGTLGTAVIDEYFLPNHSDQIMYKSDDNVFEALNAHLTEEEFETLPETEAECRPYYDALPWIKAIIVYIDAPD